MAKDSKGSSLGIYFSGETVRIVQVRAGRGHIELVAEGMMEAPPGAIEQGTIVDPAKLAAAIRSVLRKAGIAAKSANVAILSTGYTMRALQMPDIPARERSTLVRGELEAMNALPPGGGAFDFIWSTAPAASGSRQAEVYAYYTVDVTVESVREALRLAGLQLQAMEPASLAMIRTYLAAVPQKRPLAFLCASETYSDLCLHDGEKIQHIRRIPAGWGDYAREVANVPLADSLTQDEPDITPRALFDEQVPDPPIAVGTGAEPATPPASRALNRLSSTNFLAAEIARTLAFYAREFPTAPRPEALAILGISAVMAGFRTALSESLALPLADAITRAYGVTLPPDDAPGSAGAFLAALGVAVGNMDTAFPQLDISRQETLAKARQRAPVQLLSGMSVGTVWALAAAAAAIALTLMQSSDERRIVQLKQDLDALKQQRAPLLHGQQVVDAIRAARSRSEVAVAPVLGRVAAATTPGVALTGLQIASEGKIVVDGRATNAASIQTFATLLSLGRSVQSPSFEMMRQDDKNELQFRISGVAPRPVEAPSAAATVTNTGP